MPRRPDRGIALTVFPGSVSAMPATMPAAGEAVFPRFHFSRLADHAYLVADRILDARLIVYLPRSQREFEGDHQRERWYVRHAGSDIVNRPESRPFATFEQAARAIRDGSWDLLPSHADRCPVRSVRPVR